MSETSDINGREYAKLSALAPGHTVEVDEGFTCIAPGVLCTVFGGENGELFLQCADGKHLLDGQLGEDGDTLIGVYPRSDLNPA